MIVTRKLLEKFFHSGTHKIITPVFSPEPEDLVEKLNEAAIVGQPNGHIAAENGPRTVRVVVFGMEVESSPVVGIVVESLDPLLSKKIRDGFHESGPLILIFSMHAYVI